MTIETDVVESEESVRDDLMAAFTEVEAKEKGEEVPDTSKKEEVKEPEGKKEEPPAKKEEEVKQDPDTSKKEDIKQEPEGKKDEQILEKDKAPSGWSPKVREKWAEIPKDVRDEIIRREEASANGVRKLQEEVAPMRGFVQDLIPFIQEAAQNGQNPSGYIAQVMVAERALRNPDPNAKFEALLSIADSYGIPLREVINKSVGQEVLKAPQQQAPAIHPELARELQEMKQWRESFVQQSRGNELSAFSSGKEFFEDVRADMADLMEVAAKQGKPITLQQAYDKACRANDDVWAVIQERAGKDSKKTQLTDAQKRAAGGSLDSGEKIDVKLPKKDSESDSVADDIRASIMEMTR